MPRDSVKKILELDVRHPGLRQEVDARFDAGATLRAVQERILSQYGEGISIVAIWRYKTRDWAARREQIPARKAALHASQELASAEQPL